MSPANATGVLITAHQYTDLVNGGNIGNVQIDAVIVSLVNLPGDYNLDNVVNAADYVVWRKNLGGATSLPNDDTAGVGQDDFTRWRANFGKMLGSGSGAGSAIPEPDAAGLLVMSLVALLQSRRRR
jgi:hypothetical protein